MASLGKRLIYTIMARNALRSKFDAIASCKSCDKGQKDSLEEAANYFAEELIRLQGEADAQTTSISQG